MSAREIDWANIDWETIDLVELRAAAHEDLDPQWVARYGVRSFDAALVCGGIISPHESVNSIEAAKAEQRRDHAGWVASVTHVRWAEPERSK